jgi:inosose dehydratase
MTIRIGNAPCSWRVEFADHARNPTWQNVLKDCASAGYKGIELGLVGFMPEDPAQLADGLGENGMELIGGVVFRPFHNADRAQIGAEEYGLIPELHPHAGGFMDFEPEIERILSEVDPGTLKLCIDTGHFTYAGFDPAAFMKRHMARITYVHFKATDAKVKGEVIAKRTGFYDACGQGNFCNLGDGEVDFPAVRQLLLDTGFEGCAPWNKIATLCWIPIRWATRV